MVLTSPGLSGEQQCITANSKCTARVAEEYTINNAKSPSLVCRSLGWFYLRLLACSCGNNKWLEESSMYEGLGMLLA